MAPKSESEILCRNRNSDFDIKTDIESLISTSKFLRNQNEIPSETLASIGWPVKHLIYRGGQPERGNAPKRVTVFLGGPTQKRFSSGAGRC
jgi:hypothetical protein